MAAIFSGLLKSWERTLHRHPGPTATITDLQRDQRRSEEMRRERTDMDADSHTDGRQLQAGRQFDGTMMYNMKV